MGRAGRVALAAGVGIVALLVVAQLVLPALAEHRLRDRLHHDGQVQRVEVSAFPAVKLLWHRADRVEVRMGRTRAGTGRFADRLAETADTDELDARIAELTVLVLRMHDVRLRKHGQRLEAEASVSEADLRASLPPGFDVRPVAAGGGALVFEGTASFLGQRFSGRVAVAARDGRVLLAPDVPFGGLLTLTIFEDPRVHVTDVGARPAADGFTVTGTARVR